MTSGKYYVETNRLGKEAEGIIEHITDIQKNIKGLSDEIISLSDRWQGMASASFMMTYQEDCEGLNRLMTDLTNLYEQIKKAQGAYNRCEKIVESVVRRI